MEGVWKRGMKEMCGERNRRKERLQVDKEEIGRKVREKVMF